ncbi:hypothetical protein JCM8202_004923 [Rhodotorula sphaerocarpa]
MTSLVGGTIDDFVVASFPAPPHRTHTRTARTRTTATAVAYTQNPKTDHRVAVAAPAVGLAVYDLDDQTPLASVAVGPSFAPTTAPAARSTPLTETSSESARVKALRKTWVGVRVPATGDGPDSPDRGEIWCFHEDENRDGSTGNADAPKAVWPISEPLAAIAAPRTLPDHIVFLSETGTLALAPQDDLTRLVSVPIAPAPSAGATLLGQTLRLVPIGGPTGAAAEFLPPALLAALPTSSPTRQLLAVITRTYATASLAADSAPAAGTSAGKTTKKNKKGRPSAADVIAEAEAGAAAPAGESNEATTCQVELVLLDPAISVPDEFEPRQGLLRLGRATVEGASQVVVSDEGFVTSLDFAGTLSSHRLQFSSSLDIDTYPSLFFPPSASNPSTEEETAPLLPLSLAPVRSIALSRSAITPARTALLALHSSFVALASPRPRASVSSSSAATDAAAQSGSSPSVSVTYWDTRFGSVIAATDLAVPAAVATRAENVAVSLARTGRRTAVVVLEPAAPASASASEAGREVEPASGGAARRTVLFGLPLNGLPSASVLAAVVGKHTLTGRYLAAAAGEGASDASSVVLAQARRAEPHRSETLRTTNERKAALLETSRVAREQVLERLAGVLAPLRARAAAGEQDAAVREAERVWEEYLEAEGDRLWEYNKDKVRGAMEKEKERRTKAIAGGGGEATGTSEGDEVSRYKVAKRRIERALVAAGAPVRPGSEAAAAAAAEGKSWKEVTAARIKGVDDKYRYRYHSERNRKEAEMGKTVDEFDWEAAVNQVERYEPSLPSSFVTALLRLAFPVPLADSTESLEVAAVAAKSKATAAVWRHPTGMIGYLLGRDLVGENQVEGGLTRFLARAGDWPNILIALRAVPDIPEATLVSLLATVVRHAVDSSSSPFGSDSMEVDSSAVVLPAPVPALPTFLAAFLQSPYTPSVLRSALQKQLAPTEAVPVLEQCDAWLKAWLIEAEPVERKGADGEEKRKRRGKGSQAVGVDVFKVEVRAEDVPALDQIVPFVQAMLDAHFVTLLLQRQSHRLLRRLSQHVARHTEMTTDLGSLLGALLIYSSKKKEQDAARRAAASAASATAAAATQRSVAGDRGVKELGASMEKRIRAQEKHAEVGEYQVEEFFL